MKKITFNIMKNKRITIEQSNVPCRFKVIEETPNHYAVQSIFAKDIFSAMEFVGVA